MFESDLTIGWLSNADRRQLKAEDLYGECLRVGQPT